MKFKILFVFLLNLALFGSAKIDNTAPEFTLKNEYDELVSLSDFSGKTVILEFFIEIVFQFCYKHNFSLSSDY